MPKPVLSDSLFNADDVATAVLSEANLQIASSSLGVTDITNKFILGSNWNAYRTNACHHFNGFVFFFLSTYKDGVSNGDVMCSINDSDYFPYQDYYVNIHDYQGDTAEGIQIHTSGQFIVKNPSNPGSTNYHVNIQGFYRINAGN